MSLLDQIKGSHQKALRVSGGCDRCPMFSLKPTSFVPATLRDGPVLWLGEAPGKTEVETGEGFTGKAGELLRSEADDAGVPQPWSFSNVEHCRPPDNATPVPRAVECCLSQYVLNEIRDYPFVVLCGNTALNALFTKGPDGGGYAAKATHFRGNVAHHPDFPGTRFYTMYHPSAILRNPHLRSVYTQEMQRLGRIVRGEDQQSWHLARGMDALRRVLAHPIASIDFETEGGYSWTIGARIISYAATADGKEVAVGHESDPHWIAAMEAFRTFFEDPSKGAVGSNVSYDVEWHEREFGYRAKLTGIHDVGILWYEARQYKQPSLKQLVAEQLDGYRYLVHRPETIKDVDLLLNYNAEDVVHSLNLFWKGMHQLGPKTRDLVVRVTGPMSLIYQRATAHGIFIREKYRQTKLEEYAQRRKDAITKWRAEDPAFVPGMESGKELTHYLFKIRQLPILQTTEAKGDPVVDKSTVKEWIRQGATYLQNLLTIREVDKLVGTYLKAFDKHLGLDSRLHPTHWLSSTDTSRPTSTDPNVYNFPRVGEIRDMVGAERGVMIESDLSQIEFRIMVCLAQDQNGIQGYLRGDDAHTMTARTITGNPTPTKAQRSEAKPVNFGLLYGGDWPVVQHAARNEFGLDWDETTCRGFVDAFRATYPGIQIFHGISRQRLIDNRGWFESVTGHRFLYKNWDSTEQHVRDHVFRSALNSEAQGPAANICYLIAVHTRRLLDEAGLTNVVLFNSVYDSVMHEVPNPKDVPTVLTIIDEATKLAYEWIKHWFVVPLVIEHKVGKSWGSCTETTAQAAAAGT